MILPPPLFNGTLSLETVIRRRRTVRSFGSKPLTVGQLSQLLWAAQGVTDIDGAKRAAPSAGALYPLEVYVSVGQPGVVALADGIYHYRPDGHRLLRIVAGDRGRAIARVSLSQMWMAAAPLNMIITAVYQRAIVKYRERGGRYTMIEAGHVGQNIFLQAEALGLRAGIVGAFKDHELQDVMTISRDHEPLLILPVGHAA